MKLSHAATLTGLKVACSLFPHVPAMPQHLSRIAFPFAVLGVAALHCMNLAGCYQVFKFLYTPDYLCSRVLAERLALHDKKNVLQHDFGDVN